MFVLRRLHFLLISLLAFLLIGLLTGILVNPNNYESLEIRNATVEAVENGWLITMYVKNVGKLDAQISRIEVNGTAIDRDSGLSNAYSIEITIQSEIELWVKISNPPYQRGTTAIITISTTQGNQYIEQVVLPLFGTGS